VPGPLEELGGLADVAQRGHVGEHAAGALEAAFRDARDDFGEGGFAAAGRAVENQVGEAVGLNDAAQELAGAEDVVLA